MAYVRKPFAHAVRELNGEIRRKLKDGAHNRLYFKRDDLRYVYNKYRGACSKCGLNVRAAGTSASSAHFILRVPIEAGGKLDKDNLLTVCTFCRRSRKPKRTLDGGERVFGYNSFADLVEQLTRAVVEDSDEKVCYFKKQLNQCITDFVQTLFYNPVGTLDCEPVERYEGENTVADLVADIASAFKEINLTRNYTILKQKT